MSGDVQPRKRKDKKRKKDELGIEEARGTAAVLGEGDVFMHSQHDHGTGGHWCAKIIFFSLLAVLITLIGLIILENRGLSELEANSVESRYSGVLEGWLEDAPDDNHHDAHTLELKEHDDEDDHDDSNDQNDETDHNEENEHEDDEDVDDETDEEHLDEDDQDEDDEETDERDENEQDDEERTNDDEEDENQDIDSAEDEDEDEKQSYGKYYHEDDEDEEENDDDNQSNEDEQEEVDDDDENDLNTEGENISNEIEDNNDQDDDDDDDEDYEPNIQRNTADDEDNEVEDNEDDEDHDNEDDEEEDAEIETERIEKEVSEEEEPISLELPTLPEDDEGEDDDDKNDGQDQDENESNEVEPNDNDQDDDDNDFLEADDDEPPIERITAPAGKPFVEVEEEVSSERPPDTLEEEEEYEKKQEELRREEEKSSHMWLKLVVGGALLVATHAVVRRATAPRDGPEREERITREETPLIDRRMTLIPEEPSEPVVPKKKSWESPKPVIEEVVKKVPSIVKSMPQPKEESDEEEDLEEQEEVEVEEKEETKEEVEERELYSDEEAEAEEDEIVEEKKIEIPKLSVPIHKPPEPEPEEEMPDDVEIIDEEQLEDELEEEDDEEDISDVDDVELLTRLEAKYGRLPDPERPGQKHKDGGNSIEDDWPGEPSEAYWRQQLDSAEQALHQGEWLSAAEAAAAAELQGSARARWVTALALDRAADAQRDNRLLSRAITAYLHLLKMNERLSDKKLLEVTNRTLDRIQFRGNYLNAEPVYRLLIRRFPDNPTHRNNLTVSFLMANRPELAEEVLKETLQRWPDDRVALAHYGFVLKTQYNRLEEAVELFQKALEGDKGPACEPRFYYHFGDALLLLGRYPEAHEVHKRGAKHGHFLSPSQRSLYNVPRLKSQPWWNVAETPYVNLARALEKSWKDILKEGEAAQALYEKEKEGLRERGEWSQLDLFVRGREIPERCGQAPVTCATVRAEAAAVGCRRGQVKFSAMEPDTHVRPHVGPTNCRLRMHLGLSNTKDTYLRVDQETRQWQEGKVLLFDDSFEHEVWHNGTKKRLVLIVDVWHPELTSAERRQLPAI